MTRVVAHVGERTATSPVLAEWFLGWDESFGREDPDAVRRYAQRLVGSLGTVDQEVRRQWLVLDWMVGVAAPLWLRTAGLGEHADRLGACRPVTDRQAMSDAGEVVSAAARAAQDVHEHVWSHVAHLAQPDARSDAGRPLWRPALGDTDPRRVHAWGGLAGGVRSAIPPVHRFVRPACRALGYDPLTIAEVPVVWQALTRAIDEASAAIAWSATQRLVSEPAWSWHAPVDDAWLLAHAAAGAALRQVDGAFVASAHSLVDLLLQVTEQHSGTSGRPSGHEQAT